MATIAEILVKSLMKEVSDDERARLDAAANHLAMQIVNFANDVKRVVGVISRTVVQAIEQTEIDHRRRGLLQIYRQRHSWKKADLVRLRTYRLNKTALNRFAKLKASKRLGRGTTVAYIPIADHLVAVGKFLVEMHDPATLPLRRLRMLKQTKWYAEFVEMTYRGEYARMKRLGGKSKSSRAEDAVATAFCISVPTLKQLCCSVRKDAAAGFAMSRPIEVTDFEAWKNNGRLPETVDFA